MKNLEDSYMNTAILDIFLLMTICEVCERLDGWMMF